MCGLGTRRVALHGHEVRPCWTARDPLGQAPATPAPTGAPGPLAWEARGALGGRTFVPVEELVPATRGAAAPGNEPDGSLASPPVAARVSPPGAADRWSLWRELEA